MAKKKSEHYVNNRELLEALIVYRANVYTAVLFGRCLSAFSHSLDKFHKFMYNNLCRGSRVVRLIYIILKYILKALASIFNCR